MATMRSLMNRYKYAFLASVIFGFLFLLAVGQLLYQARTIADHVIADDIQRLGKIFATINDECKITGFEHQKNDIDFLNVEKFTGSKIGPMNLAAPQHWHGPYMKENPTVQEKPYQIVRTMKGYYITPGQGVQLSNKKVIGKDIILDENVDMDALLQDPQALQFKGKPLAVHISVNE
jgi:hypothetical protein